MKMKDRRKGKNGRTQAKTADEEVAHKVTYAEELLLASIAETVPANGTVLVAGNRSGVMVADLMTRGATVFAHAFDAHHARAIRDRLMEAGLTAERVLCTPTVAAPDDAPYARAYFMTTPRSMPAELVLDQLQDIYQHLAEGGDLFAAFEGDPDDALKTLKLVWPVVHVVTKAKHAALFRATKKGALKKERAFACDWEASVPGGAKLTFTSLPGCFCHRRADDGGLALAEVAAKEVETVATPYTRLLDMGCGCGLVGLLVADAARRAGRVLPVTLIDSHARAIAATQLNAARADLSDCEYILADDGLPRGRVGEYDLFVGNPPYYSDYRIADIFLETAYRTLRPGGVCLTVVKTATGLQALQEKWFKTVEVIKRRGYCVLRSVR